MTDLPRASVVIPVFNGLPYLPEAVDSVLGQTYGNVELVLVDGGSTDGSREWIAGLDVPGLVTDALPAGTPAARTWTRASELASGEFVKLLCQDDLIHPTALAAQVADLRAHPTAGMATARRDIVSASGRVLYSARGCAGLPTGLVPGRTALTIGSRKGANVFGEPLAVTFRRDAMHAALPWDDTYPFLLDMFFYAKVLAEHDLVVRHESVGAFRISASSWSTRLATSQREQFRQWQRHVERLMPQPWFRVVQSRLANDRTVVTRRAAYAWLRRRGELASPAAADQRP